MKKKYKLTNIKIEVLGKTLFRIRALRDIGKSDIHKGDLGGYIEKEENLSQYDNSWVSDDAMVFDDAEVFDDARVFGRARVFDRARVFGAAEIASDAEVGGNARIFGNVRVNRGAKVCSDADIMWISKIGSCLRTTTAFKTKDGKIKIKCDCFEGSLDKFVAKVAEKHGDNKYGREYKTAIELIKIHFGEEE